MPTSALLAGRYRLEGQIAVGGVGEVWRAEDTVLARPVAVKLLRAEFTGHAETLARFRAEARHAGALSHPAIARVYDYGEPVPPHPPFLVMELVDGPSLAGVLAAGPLGAARTMDVVAQVASGLQAAHAAGLVHRDIKPANLLIDADGQVKITDFGIAHVAGSAPVTRTGTVVGTPAYLAPERMSGAPATAAADLYALGVVAYECLTGTRPFAGLAEEVAAAHRERQLPALPPAIPGQVAQLITELTAKDPAARPASAAAVAERAAGLRDALSGSAPGAATATSWLPAQPATLPATQPATQPAQAAPAVTLSATLADIAGLGAPGPATDAQTVADPAPGKVPPGVPSRHRRAIMVAAAAATVLVLLALVTALRSGAGPPARHGAATAGRTASPARTAPASPSPPSGTVGVLAGSFIGQPLGIVRERLQLLGLTVRVRWRPSGQAQNTVLDIAPSGQVRAGSTIVVTAAFTPGHGRGHGHGGGGSNGGG
ncbi:MAG TPA: serine/threonine-protein kinase [Streptosporangiaceae bacterium]|nr:serine/threonine-protein kinase [Streptosporangiaceae bacterium]